MIMSEEAVQKVRELLQEQRRRDLARPDRRPSEQPLTQAEEAELRALQAKKHLSEAEEDRLGDLFRALLKQELYWGEKPAE